MNNSGGATLGQFIAARLVEVGCTDYFGVPGKLTSLTSRYLSTPCANAPCTGLSLPIVLQISLLSTNHRAGDFNMNLMDQLNAEKDLNMVPCCNELNAGELLFSRMCISACHYHVLTHQCRPSCHECHRCTMRMDERPLRGAIESWQRPRHPCYELQRHRSSP